MHRVSCLAVLAAVCVGFGSVRAEDVAAEPKKARPPADYSGRVQLHELPATVAPPKLPDAKEDPTRIESRSPTSPFGDRPAPFKIAPTVPGPAPDEQPSSLRDLMNENLRSSDPRSGRSGWGWLADDIATNRARRAARDSDRSRESLEEEIEQRSVLQTNAGAPSVFMPSGGAEATNGAPLHAGEMRPALEPLMGWVRDLPAGSGERQDGGERGAEFTGRAAEDADRERVWSRTDTMRGWSAPPVVDNRASDGFSSINSASFFEPATMRPAYDASPADDEESERSADRTSSSADRLHAGLLTGDPLEGTSWVAPAFTPFSLAPTEPLAIAPTPISPSVSLSTTESATPSLGGMGSAREQASPKTLPW